MICRTFSDRLLVKTGALKTRGVPTELNVYPREPHGVSERAHIADMTEKSLRWLDAWLPVNPSTTAAKL